MSEEKELELDPKNAVWLNQYAVISDGKVLLVLGMPEGMDGEHDCEEMGCGKYGLFQDHIIAIAEIRKGGK